MVDRIIVVRDEEHHEMIQFPIYGTRWETALEFLSGEGAETQLVNALDTLGFSIYEKKAAAGDEADEGSD